LTGEQEAARELVLEFFRLQDDYGIDDSLVDLTPLTSITTGEAQQLTVASVERYRELDAVQEGRVTVAVVAVGPLETDDAGQWLEVVVCADATEVDMVSKDTGQSVFSAEREPINEFTLRVDRTEQTWLISHFSSTPVGACK